MIVVTAPTGNIGHQVLRHLLDGGEPIRVIARDPLKLSPPIRARVEVVQGSHGDKNIVTKAFAGADAVFWLLPPDPRAESVEAAYVDFARTGLRSDQGPAREAGGRHIGPRERVVDGWARRVRYGIAGDGRPDRKHRGGLSVRDLSFLHGQHRPSDSAD